MFEMSKVELENWRSQFGISNQDKKGLRYAPFCFTEQGVAMLSSVINSKTAIEVNIQIIRIFTRLREAWLSNKEVLLKMEQIEQKILNQDEKTKQLDEDIKLIFNALKQLLNSPSPPRQPIGYKSKK